MIHLGIAVDLEETLNACKSAFIWKDFTFKAAEMH